MSDQRARYDSQFERRGLLGPEPLNSCSGNSWVGCRPPLQPHRLLSALDIPWEQPITRILLLRWLRSRIEEFSVGAGSLQAAKRFLSLVCTEKSPARGDGQLLAGVPQLLPPPPHACYCAVMYLLSVLNCTVKK